MYCLRKKSSLSNKKSFRLNIIYSDKVREVIKMRKYPKKCPKCGEYMEPVFGEVETLQNYINPDEPIYWICMTRGCGYTTKEKVSI